MTITEMDGCWVVIQAELPEHLVSRLHPIRQQIITLTPEQMMVLFEWQRLRLMSKELEAISKPLE